MLPAALPQATETPEATPARVNLDRPIRDYREMTARDHAVYEALRNVAEALEDLRQHRPDCINTADMVRLHAAVQTLRALVPVQAEDAADMDNPFFWL